MDKRPVYHGVYSNHLLLFSKKLGTWPFWHRLIVAVVQCTECVYVPTYVPFLPVEFLVELYWDAIPEILLE